MRTKLIGLIVVLALTAVPVSARDGINCYLPDCFCPPDSPTYGGVEMDVSTYPAGWADVGEPIELTFTNNSDQTVNKIYCSGRNFIAWNILTGEEVANDTDIIKCQAVDYWYPGESWTFVWDQNYIYPAGCMGVWIHDVSDPLGGKCVCKFYRGSDTDIQVPEGIYALHMKFYDAWWAETTVVIGNPVVDIQDVFEEMPEDCFSNGNHKNTFLNKMESVQDMIDAGDYQGAYNKLVNDIRPKVDGEDKGWVECGDYEETLLQYIDNLIAWLQTRI